MQRSAKSATAARHAPTAPSSGSSPKPPAREPAMAPAVWTVATQPVNPYFDRAWPLERAVVALEEEGGRVSGVRLESGESVRAEATILAAGGWAGALAAAHGSRVRLRPTRRHLLVTRPDPRIDRHWPVLWHLGPDEFYCRPESGGLLICACDIEDVDPERVVRDERMKEALVARALLHLPSLDQARAGAFWCGMRTLTDDGRFAVGPDPDRDGLFWVAGLAGAGMVCSAEVGRIASALLLGEPVGREVARALAPTRLALWIWSDSTPGVPGTTVHSAAALPCRSCGGPNATV